MIKDETHECPANAAAAAVAVTMEQYTEDDGASAAFADGITVADMAFERALASVSAARVVDGNTAPGDSN
jgi:hypothetical protein